MGRNSYSNSCGKVRISHVKGFSYIFSHFLTFIFNKNIFEEIKLILNWYQFYFKIKIRNLSQKLKKKKKMMFIPWDTLLRKINRPG